MLTARRLQERRAAEAAGLPPPAPPLPDLIPRAEHERLFNELRTAHGAEVAALRGGDISVATFEFMGETYTVEALKAQIEQAESEIAARLAELEGKVTEALAQLEVAQKRVAELESENTELNELLEKATADTGEAKPPEGNPAPTSAEAPAGEPAASSQEPAAEPSSTEPAASEAKGKGKKPANK